MIQVRGLINVSRDKVFEMWTDPKKIKRWWMIEGYTTPVIEMNPVIGGKYRIGMKPQEGELSYISGIFSEVEGGEKLVYTWTLESAEDLIKDTRVSVEFHDLNGSTEILITHEFLREQLEDAYLRGWRRLLMLLKALSSDIR